MLTHPTKLLFYCYVSGSERNKDNKLIKLKQNINKNCEERTY